MKSTEVGQVRPPVSIRGLFRFADKVDVMFMTFGSIAAVANGVTMPLFSLVFGSLISLFQEGEILKGNFDLQSEVNRLTIYFVILGFAGFSLTFLEYFFWSTAALRQSQRMRSVIFETALRKNVGYIDTKTASTFVNVISTYQHPLISPSNLSATSKSGTPPSGSLLPSASTRSQNSSLASSSPSWRAGS